MPYKAKRKENQKEINIPIPSDWCSVISQQDPLDIISEEELQAEAGLYGTDCYLSFEDAFDYMLHSSTHLQHAFSTDVGKQFMSLQYLSRSTLQGMQVQYGAG